ncbi:MAG: BglG family transcription antiterminator [Liquorilactobacillus hordei]|uniref:BglG family transcription antiterminator n=1 Tax=Liquorilactobacillus hordei TaxID=468911 RepID=UPI0039EC4A15
MDILTKRQKMILNYLLQKGKVISGQEMAKEYDVTTRTIRNDIVAIEGILANNAGIRIESIRGKGYKIEVFQSEKLFSFLETLNDNVESNPIEPEERVNYIINRFLLSSEYLKIDNIADELFISRSTLQNDLLNVKVVLEKFGLKIVSKPGHGLYLVGDEKKRRYAISEQIISEINNHNNSNFENIILPQEEIKFLKKIVLNQLKQANLDLSDMALNNLIVHIAIACKRVREGSYIQNTSVSVSHEKEFLVAKKIVKQIENKLNISFPDVEVTYITMHLMGTKTFFNKNERKNWGKLEYKISSVSKEMIKIVEEKLNMNFEEDTELLAALSLHLKPVLHRYENNMSIRNTMLEAIKINYPIAFEAGVSASKVLEKRFNITVDESEIGFIALHIGAAIERKKNKKSIKNCLVVCTTGLGSSRLLYYKLKSKFGDRINIIGTTELHNIDLYDEKSIDLIISTVPLPTDIKIPFIVVDVLLGSKAIKEVENEINLTNESFSNLYLNQRTVYLHKNLKTPDEVIKYICNDLIEKKLVSRRIIESVLAREAAASTSFGNYVAMPHPLEAFSNDTFWSLLTLKEPIIWNDKKVQIVCFLHIASSDMDELEPLYKELLSLLDDKKSVKKLINANSKSEVIKILEKINKD